MIADDHDIVRQAVCAVVDRLTPFSVCGEAADGAAAVELAEREKPDLAILDISMPILDGLAATSTIVRRSPRTRVIIFTQFDDLVTVRRAITAGARGYVVKTESLTELQAALMHLARNQPYFSTFVTEALLAAGMHARRQAADIFTPREVEVIRQIASGATNREIAHLLGISLKTVEAHRTAVLRKAGARSAPQMVRFAIKNGALPDERPSPSLARIDGPGPLPERVLRHG